MNKLKFTEKQTEMLDKTLTENNINESRNNLTAKQQMIFIASQMTSSDLLGPKRLEDELYEDYKVRCKLEKLWQKMRSSGKFVWVSVSMSQEPQTGMWINNGGGTYQKKVHGFLSEASEHKAKKLAERKLKNTAKKLGVLK